MDSDREEETDEKFDSAASFVQANIQSINKEHLLLFYGYYKQSIVGPCDIPKPSWYEMEAKAKWNSWNQLGNMAKTTAMDEYVKLLTELRPDWDANAGGSKENKSKPCWVSVSCMADREDVLDSDCKTVFDWVKEGNVDMLKKSIDVNCINDVDESGMGLIHWAADRGDVATVKAILDLAPDVNLLDETGQTALHYASACGHLDSVKLLMEHGASTNIKDSEGFSPADVALSQDIQSLIQQFS